MVDSTSRIVAAGDANTTQTFLGNLRMSASGTLDTTYGTNGIDATTPGAIEDAALGSDDRLYVVGYSGRRLVVWLFGPSQRRRVLAVTLCADTALSSLAMRSRLKTFAR